jgi:hypothetical protein
MWQVTIPSILRTIPVSVAICLIAFPVHAKYSGGSGTAADPYLIADANDLIHLGETPADYDKHFILTADVNLAPSLPGRKVFDKAVIAPDTSDVTQSFEGSPFAGVFNGNRHKVSNLTIQGGSYLGLFGRLALGSEVRNLGVTDVRVTGSGSYVGGLTGVNGDVWESLTPNGAVWHTSTSMLAVWLASTWVP